MFRGRFEHSIDAKGRLSIPSKVREVLVTHYRDERLVVTNFDSCLWAYPLKEWEAVEEKIASLPQFKEEVKALVRVFVSGAAECPVDRAGRIVLPPTLRDYGGIVKDVVLVGSLRRIEIWSKERWQQIFSDAQGSLKTMSEQLAELGL